MEPWICCARLYRKSRLVGEQEVEGRSGDAQARCQTCGQIQSTEVLLRGGADGIRADQEAWPRLHRGGTLVHPEETWRSGEDEPTRCGSLPEFPGGGAALCLRLNFGTEMRAGG